MTNLAKLKTELAPFSYSGMTDAQIPVVNPDGHLCDQAWTRAKEG